jgi:hypothetical protein
VASTEASTVASAAPSTDASTLCTALDSSEAEGADGDRAGNDVDAVLNDAEDNALDFTVLTSLGLSHEGCEPLLMSRMYNDDISVVLDAFRCAHEPGA